MLGRPDKFVCFDVREFDKKKVKFPEPTTIRLEHGGEIKQIIPTYIDGYLQTEFCEVYFYRGISEFPENDEKRNLCMAAFTLAGISEEYHSFLYDIHNICKEKLDDDDEDCRRVNGPVLPHVKSSGKKVNAKYFEYTREKTQIIGPNGSLLDLHFFLQTPFRAIPILRFDLIGRENQYVVRALIVSMIVTNFEIEMGPEIHQKTLEKFTPMQISRFEEKYQKLQTRKQKAKREPTKEKLYPRPRKDEKEEKVDIHSAIRENLKHLKAKTAEKKERFITEDEC